jgi:1-acyl-sn-glycerol-3-phosphate acyltransferase
MNHSFATYDVFLLGAAIYEASGRLPCGLADRWLFKLPGLRALAMDTGLVEANVGAARELLLRGEIVGLAPGGMREALRPSTQRYRVRGDDRKGFARLAVSAQSPIILAACPRADDLYTVSTGWLTEFAYNRFKLPVAFARGVAGTPLPRRIQLTHYLSEPISPPRVPEGSAHFEDEVSQFHGDLTRRMEQLMARGAGA